MLHSWTQLIKQSAQRRHHQTVYQRRHTRISGAKNISIVGAPSRLLCDYFDSKNSAHTSLSHVRRSVMHCTPAYWINVNKSTLANHSYRSSSKPSTEMIPVEESLAILRCRVRHSSGAISRHGVDDSVIQRSADLQVVVGRIPISCHRKVHLLIV